MGSLSKTYLMPHPPIMIHEVGKGREIDVKDTIRSAHEVGDEISKIKPDTIIILVPPHGPAFSDAISINVGSNITGNLGNFGASSVKFDYQIDKELINSIKSKCDNAGIPIVEIDSEAARRYGISPNLDHGSMVPLYFVNQHYNEYKIVHITYGLLSLEELYAFGKIIRETVSESDRNAVFIASGDLSHRLTKDAPAGYNPDGRVFDEKIVEYLRSMQVLNIIQMDRNLTEAAGECGFRSIVTMLGIFDAMDVQSSIKSYEGPFGVGYCVAGFDILKNDRSKELLKVLISNKREMMRNIREDEDEYVRLARKSLEHYIKNGTKMGIPDNLPDEMLKSKAGVFVSIKKNGELRGCIGTTGPTRENIAEEIVENAISSGIRDPRFYPVQEDELNDLIYSVDALSPSQSVNSKDELDVKRYGVIVRRGRKSGLLLPNLEGVDTVDEQINIALRKAGIGKNEDYKMERFEVIRHR